MNLRISGHHLDITDSLRHFIASKMDRLERHSNDVQNIHVILNVEKLKQKAEATVRLKGTQLFADTSDSDMYAAIDTLTDKLDRQLIKHKEKVKGYSRGRLSDIGSTYDVVADNEEYQQSAT